MIRGEHRKRSTAAPGGFEFVAGAVVSDTGITPTRTDFVRFAGAGGDFNPAHHDDVYARDLGYPSVFGMGMWTASVASRLLVERFGPGALRSYAVRFMGFVWPDRPLRFVTNAVDRRIGEGETLIDLSISVSGEDGPKMTGIATIGLPNVE